MTDKDNNTTLLVSNKGVKNMKGERKRMQDHGSSSNVLDTEDDGCNLCAAIMIFFSWIIVAIIPIFWPYCFRTVRNYEKALIFRLGKLQGNARGPGLFLINPCTDQIRIVDIRMEASNLPPQDMMTKDAVTVNVDAIAFFKVINPKKAVLEVEKYKYAFNMIAATTLRAVIGSYDLQALLSERDEINERVRTTIEEETSGWGVVVPAVEVKDIKLPVNMQRAMAAEAEAKREKRAKIISAEGEAESAKMLSLAADLIANAPGALQLRYLHTLVQISQDKNSTVLFPLPMEVMKGMPGLEDDVNIKTMINKIGGLKS